MPAKLCSEKGFTLVEVLVALVITSFLLGIVMNGALLARRRSNIALQKSEAIFVAQDVLGEAAISPFAEGVRRGKAGSLRWQVNESIAQADPRGQFVLANLAVTVSANDGRSLLTAETRRLKALRKN